MATRFQGDGDDDDDGDSHGDGGTGRDDMARRVREHDWSATPLGPRERWPVALRITTDLLLAHPLPMLLLWGPERTAIPNDAWRARLGDGAAMLGEPFRADAGAAAGIDEPSIRRARAGGTARIAIRGGGGPTPDPAATLAAAISPVFEAADRIAGVLVTATGGGEDGGESGHGIGPGADQTVLLRLSDALRPLADVAAIQSVAARILGEHLGVNQVHYGENVGEMVVIAQAYGRGLPPMIGRFRALDFGERLVATYQAGRTAICRDIDADPTISAAERGVIAGAGFRAYIGVPLLKAGRWSATLAVHSRAPRRWTAAEVALVEGMAERTWAAVERARAETALRRSEERFRALVVAGAYSIYRMSPDWRVMYQLDSDTLANTTEPIDNWVEKYIPPEDLPVVEAAIARSIATRSLFELEHRVRVADGGIGWVVSRAVPLTGPDGEITEWFGAGSDVTERRLAVERLRESEEDHRVRLERQVDARTAELKESRDLLRATMDSSPDMIQVFEAVRDAAGEIVDFRWILNNHRSESLYGDVRGQSLLQRNPGVVAEGIFDAFRQVVETGEPRQDERHYVHEQFDGWFLQTAVKLDGGVATTTRDVTAWKRSEEEIIRLRDEAQQRGRESEERLRQFGEASQDVLWIRDARTWQWEYLTPAFEAIYGLDRERALRGDNMAGWLELVVPEDRAHAAASLRRVQAGERVTFEYRIRRPADGGIRWLRNTDFPIRDAAGTVVRIGGIGHDVTALKATERALAATELRQRTLVEGMPQLVWRAAEDGGWTWASPQWTAFTGQAEADSHGWGWLAALHPDDRQGAREAWARAARLGRLTAEYRIRRADGGGYRWFHGRALAVRDAAGQVLEWLGTSTDIDDLRTLQDRQQVLVTELQHRTFNLMGVVRSMADATLRSSDSLDAFRRKFRDRIDALARVQRLLSQLREGERITFDALVRGELTAAGAFQPGEERVTLDGPEGVALRSGTVQTLAMAIHELTTNALKYGALHQPDAHLDVRWRVEVGSDRRPWLHVDWTETGVAMPPARARPAGTGQGRTLIEEALPYQLRARTSYVMAADGVRCSIALPVVEGADGPGERPGTGTDTGAGTARGAGAAG